MERLTECLQGVSWRQSLIRRRRRPCMPGHCRPWAWPQRTPRHKRGAAAAAASAPKAAGPAGIVTVARYGGAAPTGRGRLSGSRAAVRTTNPPVSMAPHPLAPRPYVESIHRNVRVSLAGQPTSSAEIYPRAPQPRQLPACPGFGAGPGPEDRGAAGCRPQAPCLPPASSKAAYLGPHRPQPREDIPAPPPPSEEPRRCAARRRRTELGRSV